MNGFPCEIRIHQFLTPKKGTIRSECEDAFAFSKSRMVFALADGATESYDSRSWARLLVRAWIRIQPPAIEMEDFEPLLRDLGVRLHQKWSRRKLPWYAEEKAQGGSFAAFVGLQISAQEGLIHWRAIALGDCCLIHRHGPALLETFPITKSEEFGSNPLLLPSSASKQGQALDLVRRGAGTTSSGNDFLLMSDAVACWFLKQIEDGKAEAMGLFDKLTAADDIGGLTDFLENLRSAGNIRNDDVAVLRIVIV